MAPRHVRSTLRGLELAGYITTLTAYGKPNLYVLNPLHSNAVEEFNLGYFCEVAYTGILGLAEAGIVLVPRIRRANERSWGIDRANAREIQRKEPIRTPTVTLDAVPVRHDVGAEEFELKDRSADSFVTWIATGMLPYSIILDMAQHAAEKGAGIDLYEFASKHETPDNGCPPPAPSPRTEFVPPPRTEFVRPTPDNGCPPNIQGEHTSELTSPSLRSGEDDAQSLRSFASRRDASLREEQSREVVTA